MAEHAVIVRFDYGSTDLSALFELEDELERAIAEASAGEYDGNEVAVDGSNGLLYMYGPDADALFAAVRETLSQSQSIRNVTATLRYGPPANETRRVEVRLES